MRARATAARAVSGHAICQPSHATVCHAKRGREEGVFTSL